MGDSRSAIEVLARGVFVCDGQLLVCRTRGADNTYLPGGHVEFEESAPVSLAREIDEEMGLACRVREFLGAVEHTFIQKRGRHCEINLVFHCEIDGLRAGRPVPTAEKHLEFAWIPLAELEDSDLEPTVLRRRIPHWLTAPADQAWGSTYACER